MKKLFTVITFLCCLIAFSNNADAQRKTSHKSKSYKPKTVRVKSYTTKKGKHVRSHYRSKPSRRKYNYLMPMVRREELAA